MKTLIATIAILFCSSISDGFTWFETTLSSFVFVIAVLQDLHTIGQNASKAKVEELKNELVEMSNENKEK